MAVYDAHWRNLSVMTVSLNCEDLSLFKIYPAGRENKDPQRENHGHLKKPDPLLIPIKCPVNLLYHGNPFAFSLVITSIGLDV